ncbi:Bgt-20428 [Blumeria graminis f. sp. tritici]|uniref:Bgt-20428 n=2 Tax=Blumeria graminis f. sp. tritici TaxID=62690 RepID=A0A381L1W5_BLUGR|nr:Bgt-20428 [Blumeria graminis f. sp. tritici]
MPSSPLPSGSNTPTGLTMSARCEEPLSRQYLHSPANGTMNIFRCEATEKSLKT